MVLWRGLNETRLLLGLIECGKEPYVGHLQGVAADQPRACAPPRLVINFGVGNVNRFHKVVRVAYEELADK